MRKPLLADSLYLNWDTSAPLKGCRVVRHSGLLLVARKERGEEAERFQRA